MSRPAPARRDLRRPLGLVAAAVLALTTGATAVGATAAASPGAPESRGWVTGRVVDRSGNPVVGDLVNAIGPREVPEAGVIADRSDRRTWTDADGRFRVRQAGPGYLIQICDPEPSNSNICRETDLGVNHLITYVGPDHAVTDSWVPQTALIPMTGAVRRLGQVTMKPQSFVHGRIRRAHDQLVQIERRNGSVAYRAETDAHGNYRISGLAPGHYRMAAGGDGEGWLPWRSGVITLGSQQDVEVDGRLRRGASVSGVLRAAGGPVAGVDVLLRSGGDPVAATTTDSRGRYRISGLRLGTYRVGILYDGSDYQRHGVKVTLPDPTSSVARDVRVRLGAVVTIAVRDAQGGPATDVVDELRNAAGHPIAGLTSDSNGHVRYTGLGAGTYHFYGATGSRYATTTIHVTTITTYDLGRLRLSRPTLTLTGTTAPNAVVSATTGDQCPPDGDVSPGAFQVIEKADAAGHYTVSGLVPGRYMLRADGWPANYVPHCVSGVAIRKDRSYDLPLQEGATAAGRLVYSRTGTPVITTLSYELHYPKGSPVQPTLEQPARAKTRSATGRFLIDALGPDTVTGRLAQGADLEQINNNEFLVVFPFQDGTPYYLTSGPKAVTFGAGMHLHLGDIGLHLHR